MCVKNRTRSKAFKWRSDGVQMAFRNRSGLRKNCVKPWCLEDVFFLTHLRSQDRNGGVQQQLEEWTIQLNCPRPAHHGKRLLVDPQEKWVYWQGFHNLPLFGESLVGVGWLPLTFDLASTLWTQCESFTQFALRIAAGPRGLKYSWNPHHVSGNLKKQRLELWLAGGWSRCLCCSCRAETSAHEWWSDQEVAAGGDRDPPIWG